MTTISEVPVPRSATDEPSSAVGRGWISYWTLALFGMYAAYYAAAQIVLPKQAQQIAGDEHKVAVIAVVTAVSSLVSIIVVLLTGALSDRTLAGRGRRQIWVTAGALVTGAAFVGQGLMTAVVGMVLVWAVANAGMAAMTAALFAAVPDEVPVNQRAWVSAFFGISVSAGPLVGIALVSLVITDVLPGYVLLGAIVVLLALPFGLGTRGVPLRHEERQHFSLGVLAKGIADPLRHADFAWAFSGRFFIQLSNALAQVFLYFYLQDFLHYDDPDTGIFILTLIYTIAAVVTTLPAGRISDRTLKRKRMVVISSVLQGLSGLIFAFLPNFTAAMIGAAILGVGYGAYAAVDQALITQVLPHPEDRGKDLGVINIANVLPYVLTGLIGGVVINAFGYPTLMVLVLVTAVIAALTVRPIKGVA
jgi:MFS family permease